MKVISKTSCALLLSPTLLVIPLLAYFYQIVKQDPNVLFKVPKYGFILYDIYTTHFQNDGKNSNSDALLLPRSPFFIDEAAYLPCYEPYSASNNVKRCAWLKPGDVVVTSCGKCGTNWLMTIAHEIRMWDKPDNQKEFDDIMDILPWPEVFSYPGENIEERVVNWGDNWNRSDYRYRAYKSHFAPHYCGLDGRTVLKKLLPVKERPDVKFLVMMRNPVDAAKSALEFFPKHTDYMEQVWGGFTTKNFDLNILMSMLPNPNSYVSNLGFFKYWKQLKDELAAESKSNVNELRSKNVLLLHYTDVFANPRYYIKLIADFLDVKLTEEGIDTVERRTSFAFMKKRSDKYKYRVKSKEGRTDLFMLQDDAIVNSGGVDGKNVALISKEQEEKIKLISKEVLGDELYEIAMNGFDHFKKQKK